MEGLWKCYDARLAGPNSNHSIFSFKLVHEYIEATLTLVIEITDTSLYAIGQTIALTCEKT